MGLKKWLLIGSCVACTHSPSTENCVDTVSNETVLQGKTSTLHKKEEMQQQSAKPILLSEEQYVQLIADFRTSDKKYKGEKPCVVDFYANWCHPCKMMLPTFEKLAEKYGDEVNFYKINVDSVPNIAVAYNITSIPTLFFINSKGTFSKTIGLLSEEEMEKSIQSIIK